MEPPVTVSKRDEHSIRNEPFYGQAPLATPDSVSREPALAGEQRSVTDDERALHNVWDEPAFRASGQATPETAVNYTRWYEEHRRTAAWWHSWGAVLLIALCGGPFAAVGTILTSLSQGTMAGVIVLVAVGPALEEMMKIGVLLIVLENRPYLFRSGVQVFIAAMASGALFAVVENLLYIYLYNPEGSDLFRLWRWTVCTALHTGATTVAGMGVFRMWQQSASPASTANGAEYVRPEAKCAYPYIVAAVLIHGAYNGLAILMEMALGPM